MKYRHIYSLLKAYGFSPAMAATIILEAQRKSVHARKTIGIVFKTR